MFECKALLLTISPVLDSDRSVIGASVISRDITGRKIAAEALRKANETSVYASPVPIIAVDTDNRVTTWNPAAEELFGWSEKEVMGRPLPIIPIDEADAAAVMHQRLLLGEVLTGIEVRRRKPAMMESWRRTAQPLICIGQFLRGHLRAQLLQTLAVCFVMIAFSQRVPHIRIYEIIPV